ncbi:MAG: PAS domain S-box protein [Bradymonadales bacterium]|nr:MAG: PAS domain S-box protein [Bradymonadales bacterium]
MPDRLEKLEEKITSTEEVLSAVSDLTFLVDRDTRVVQLWYRDVSALFIPPGEVRNRKLSELVPADLIEPLQRAIDELDRGQLAEAFEYQDLFTAGDDGARWFECRAMPTPNPDQFVLVISDVTERRRLRSESKALRFKLDRAQEELATFFETAPELLCIAGTDGRFKKLNRAWERLGYSDGELLQRPFIDFVHPDDVEPTLREIEALRSGRTTIQFKNRYRTKDGSYRTLSWNTTPDLESQLLYAAARDVTEMEDMEQQLAEAKALAKMGTWTFHQDFRRSKWCSQMREIIPDLFGSRDNLNERLLLNIHPHDRRELKSGLERSIRSGQPLNATCRVGCGNEFSWIELRAKAKWRSTGEFEGLVGTCQDVTERLQAEQSLQEERLKTLQVSKLASLGELSAGVAHEINNPLSIISANLKLLERYREQPERFQKKIEVLEKSCRRVSRIVRGLKRFSRSSAADARGFHRLSNIIAESVALVESRATRGGVEIRLNQEVDCKFFCNEIEIEQVLVNLMNNSIDALRGQPGAWLELCLTEQSEEVLLSVKDSGAGISKEFVNRLFEPFFTTKEVGSGTGLGLSICRGILKSHHASIRLNDSGPNTCFEIRLPKRLCEIEGTLES